MEEALLQIEQERTYELPQLSQNEWNKATEAARFLADSLRQVLVRLQGEQLASVGKIDAAWLMKLCSNVPSQLGPHFLVRAIWSAAQLPDEAQQQGALFDALGESGMEVMFQVAEHMKDIKRIPERDLPQDNAVTAPAASVMDPEVQRRERLLQEAQNTAHVAAIAREEADLRRVVNGGGTHTVTRKSELQLLKAAEKAEKRAEKALKAAKEGGAILDDSAFIAINNAALGNGGLMGVSKDELLQLQHSLMPEGTREYAEKQGLPKGTEREFGNGFEKVTIPAAHRDEKDLHRRLHVAEILDEQCRKAFSGTTTLNPMQSTVFETAFTRRDNMLVCAPTGAGKTNVALLAVMAHFRDVGLIPGFEGKSLVETGKKVVYIAPMKALAQEIVEKFDSKLRPTLHLIVKELTGDMQLTRAEADAAHVLVTTPEKWDVVTRKSGSDENSLGNQCGLLIIDEVHLLADDRGAVIESVVARLHRLVESRQRQVRIVGLSATLPNYQDVAAFLQVPAGGLFYFGPEHRPVPLQQTFIGVTSSTRDRYARDKKMNEVCYDVVVDSLRRGYQVMVFVHSRKGTGETVSALTAKAQEQGELEPLFITQGKEGINGEAHKRYADRVKKSRNREVALHFANGLGIHHAGMLRGDRKLTEQLFHDGAIKVLACTATLAWGINLPAHTVVIKGTEVYNPEKGGMMDLSILDVQQIFGRAGRPQFDSSGEATLITSHDGLARYLDKLVRAVPIESSFIKQLADHLNAEVVGGTVTNIQEAATWLNYTYLHVRMLKNPLAYGITEDQKADDPMLRGRSMELVQHAAKLLDENQMLRYDVNSGNLAATNLGRVSANFYIQVASVAVFNEKLASGAPLTDAELCYLICCATEFENVKIRQEEFGEIEEFIPKACPLKVAMPLHEPSDKAYVLMQAFISRYSIRSFTLISDTNYIASNAGRVARAMFEMCLRRSMAGPAVKLLRIAKSIDKRIWWFQSPLRQFEGELQAQVFSALESKKGIKDVGYDQFEFTLSLLDMQHQEVGQLIHLKKEGDKVQKLIGMLPRIEIECTVQPVSSSVLRFHITLRPRFNWHTRWHGGAQSFWLWVEDNDNNRIYHHEHVIFSRRTHPDALTLDLTIPTFDPLPNQYYLRVISDTWVGVEMVVPVSFRHVQIPEQETVHTDLINLTPLPTSALHNPDFEKLYMGYDTFNPIQTQLFHVLYHTDSPVFLGAPTGSGKTIVAELALLRMKRLHPKGICVYIAPLKSLARERLQEWQRRLGSAPLKWKVLELSGDTSHDKKALSTADVLVCTPEKWDLISRGWRGNDFSVDSNVSNGKEFVKQVRLLVIDEIHLLGEERGAVLEAIVSRTRFISKYVENIDRQQHEYTRLIGLSTALANPYDLADWLGIDTKSRGLYKMRGLYNFRPSVRPIPMTVHIQGYPGRHYCPRMATMNKPCYAAIKEHSPTKPTLIFVASRRQTRLTAMDIISFAAGDENAKIFLGCSEDYIESIAESIEDESLRHTITYGIGIHHAGLSTNDRDMTQKLFLEGQIRVLVATSTLAWGVNLPAHFVIVKGTEYFDGKTSRYVDFPLTDVLQMIGRAGRPGFDTKGTALVMVAEDKKNFYKKFLYSPFPLESCLGERMCENLNAEVATRTITSIVDAVGYLSWTFYARRVKANPSFYGAKSGCSEDVDDFLIGAVKNALGNLEEHKCVELGEPSGEDRSVKPTLLGQAAANYYLQYRTPKQMLVGVKEVSKAIMALLSEFEAQVPFDAGNAKELRHFQRWDRIDEISIASLLYSLASTHEFDELPVRHNEEYLNADLSDDLMWGADISEVMSSKNRDPGKHRKNYRNLDVMADPHTKCFLLLQAFLERAKLPISDYINDTKTVLSQVPRLLAAMHFVAVHDYQTAGSFELICQISRARQLIATRSVVSDDPLQCLPGFSPDALRHMEIESELGDKEAPKLWSLRHMPRPDAVRYLQPLIKGRMPQIDRMLDAVYSIPVYSIDEMKVLHIVDKTSNKSIGKLNLTISIDYGKGSIRNVNTKPVDESLTLAIVLGSPQRRTLLAHRSIGVSRSGSSILKKQVELSFDWMAANADGGVNGGFMVLRLFMEEIRGLDGEIRVSMH